MAIDAVTICNLALSRMKGQPIDSLDERTPAAENCRILYPITRDIILTDFPWNFSRKVQILPQLAEDNLEWEYMFSYPADALGIRYLVPVDENGETASKFGYSAHDRNYIDYMVTASASGGKAIATSYERVAACYSMKVTDTTVWDFMVDDLIAWRLASELAIPLGGDSGARYRDQAINAYEIAAARAKAKTANESFPRKRQEMPRAMTVREEGINPREEVIRNRRR